MTRLALSLCGLALFALSVLDACDREGPPRPVGTATNKHVEESPARPPTGVADTLSGAVITPLDKARQTEDTIQGAADRTKKQAENVGQ